MIRSASSGLGSLQMVSKSDTPDNVLARNVSSKGKWTRGDVVARTLDPKGVNWGFHID